MKKSVRIFWRIFFGGIAFFLVLIVLIDMGVFGKMPSIAQLENPSIVEASEVFAADGTLMGKYYKERGNRSIVGYNEISKHVINALVATEDRRFFEHSGIDGKGVARAFFFLGTEGGGSTITQQLALNLFNERASNPIVRIIQKLKEWIIAVKLERNFTKEEILALYLNTVPYSDNVYGIRNASRTFFSVNPDRLNIEEAALLIGMVNGPGVFNPRRNPKASLGRRNTVINKMLMKGYINEQEAVTLKRKPITLHYQKLDENSGLAPYFRQVIREDLKKWCKQHTNPSTGEPYDLYEDGLKIYTTINPRMQLYAEEAVVKHMPAMQKYMNSQRSIRSGKVWAGHEKALLSQMKATNRWENLANDGLTEQEIRATFTVRTPMRVFAWNAKREKDTIMTPLDSIKYHRQMLQTAFMVMDPANGEVKAWVGGIDFRTYKFDHANINTKRQVGSTIKPFLYCQAVEEDGFTPETECEQTSQFFEGYGWVPAKKTVAEGTLSMASGLAFSVNEVSAYLMKQITPKRFVDFLKRINIQSEIEPYPSIALGACELSLYEMLWGYTMFPNSGYSSKPIYITRIEDRNGNLLESFSSSISQVISEASSYTMAKMMQGVVDAGTAAGLRERLGAVEMGGKTGTTNENSDAWFIGYTPQLLAGAWVGCDDRFIRLSETKMGFGGKAARPIYEYFFAKVYADKTLGIERDARFMRPENFVDTKVDSFAIDITPPPGTGDIDLSDRKTGYFEPVDTSNVPLDSKPFVDDVPSTKNQVNTSVTSKPDSGQISKTRIRPDSIEVKKKRGLLKRLFGGGKKDD
jgi:penicillin-binding protein 1A